MFITDAFTIRIFIITITIKIVNRESLGSLATPAKCWESTFPTG